MLELTPADKLAVLAAQARGRRAENPEKYRLQARERYQRKKETIKAQVRAYQERHKDKVEQRGVAYRATHRLERAAASRRYYAANREECLADANQYYGSNRESILQKLRNERAENPEAIRAKEQAKRVAHPEYSATKNRNRRARMHAAPINDLTHAQWLEIQEAQDYRCYYCKKRRKGRLTQDHLTPLSKAGSHTVHNVIAACKSCNSRKWIHPPPMPVQPLLLTVAPARKPKAS
jgi:5-methylcytosine-specific restriction endonuclease McrA